MTNVDWRGGSVRIVLLAALAWTVYCFYSDPPFVLVRAILENPTSTEAALHWKKAAKERDDCVAAAMKHAPPDRNAALPFLRPLTKEGQKCYDEWQMSGVAYPRPYSDFAWTSLWGFLVKWVGGLLVGLFAVTLVYWIALGFAPRREDA